eukprot:10573-Heterococcus_DN1.PRE.6
MIANYAAVASVSRFCMPLCSKVATLCNVAALLMLPLYATAPCRQRKLAFAANCTSGGTASMQHCSITACIILCGDSKRYKVHVPMHAPQPVPRVSHRACSVQLLLR